MSQNRLKPKGLSGFTSEEFHMKCYDVYETIGRLNAREVVCTMKDNVRDFKVYKGNGKTPTVFMPRFIRDVRTVNSERYSIIMGEDFELVGTLDLHISDIVQATLVIIPDVEQDTLELLLGLIKMELLEPLQLDIESFNIFKGVSDCIVLDEEDFFDEDDDD
ncbi:MAG: hypothetical protein P4L69_14155 [Desulfosporosinus sp.]|nr:hypothetical protein [Desulfosporosinus sp.]